MKSFLRAFTACSSKWKRNIGEFSAKIFLLSIFCLTVFPSNAISQGPLPGPKEFPPALERCFAIMREAASACERFDADLVSRICRAVRDYYLAVHPPCSLQELSLLTAALIKRESCFDPRAVSPQFAVGLMQVHYPYWKRRFPDLRLADLYDPYFNVGFALWILDAEWRRTGSLTRALAYYGGWPGLRGKAWTYVRRILREVYLLQQKLAEDGAS